jgi:predicted DNA binding protein
MWVAKLQIYHDDWIIDKTIKYNLTASGIPLNSYKKNDKTYHNGMVFLNGAKENKKKFIDSLKDDKRIIKSKASGSQIFVLIEGEDHIAPLMPKEIFFLKPVFFKGGYEYWEIGSWEKSPITKFYEECKSVAEIKLLKLQEEDPAVFIQYAVPKLTQKQQSALNLALEYGYYSYPREISVEELAKKSKTPRSTYQEHLRKAESKLMRLLIQSIT